MMVPVKTQPKGTVLATTAATTKRQCLGRQYTRQRQCLTELDRPKREEFEGRDHNPRFGEAGWAVLGRADVVKAAGLRSPNDSWPMFIGEWPSVADKQI